MRNARPWHTSSGGCRPQLPGHNPFTPGWRQLLHLHDRAHHFHLTASVFCNLFSLGPRLWYPCSTSSWCCWQSPLQQSKLLSWHFLNSLVAEAAFRDLWCLQFTIYHHLWGFHSTSCLPTYPSIPICHCYIGLLFGQSTRLLGRLQTRLSFVGIVLAFRIQLLSFVCCRNSLTFFHELPVRGILSSLKFFLMLVIFPL